MLYRAFSYAHDDQEEPEDHPSSFSNLLLNVDLRRDIFQVDSSRSLQVFLSSSLVVGIACGLWLRTLEFPTIAREFFVSREPTRAVTLRQPISVRRIERPSRTQLLETRTQHLGPNPRQRGGKGRGDPRTVIKGQGILAMLNGKGSGLSVVGADVIQNGFADDLDEVLRNVTTLQRTGRPTRGRPGLVNTNKEGGYTGSGGTENGIGEVFDAIFGNAETVALKRSERQVTVKIPPILPSAPSAMGGRTQESIMKVVNQHLPGLRHAYNTRLKMKPGLRGKILVRFGISAQGVVTASQIVGGTLNDAVLEQSIVNQILRWQFDPVEKEGTVVVDYPFAFSQ